MDNSGKIILDLCAGTGAWSRPYLEAGYDVRLITLPQHDVLTYEPPHNVYGILAAPPCNCFSRVGARWWEEMDIDGRTEQAIAVFQRCYSLCLLGKRFWVLENPPGRHWKLMPWLDRPTWQFQPYHFGDPWRKQTYLWGRFNPPWPTDIVKPHSTKRAPSGHTQGRIAYLPGGDPRRALTPSGFAQAFYEANP